MLDPKELIKHWQCDGGHALGLVRRDKNGTDSLYLFRRAIDLEKTPESEIAEVDVIGVICGYAADIRCSECGRLRSWVRGKK